MPHFLKIFLDRFKEYIVLILILIISLSLIPLNENHKVKNLRVFSLGIFASLNSFITNASSVSYDKYYVEQLEKRNAELMLQVNKLREYGLEHERLNKIFEFASTQKYDLVVARIVSRLVSKINGYFIISKGKKEGIERGMPVITDQGLVGLVIDVADDYSSVRTYENSLFKLAVKNERSNVNGILNWNGRKLVISNVPTTEDMEIGDKIIVSELSSIIPPSIPIGKIIKKEGTVSGILTNIIVEPYTNINKLKTVIVEKTIKNIQLDSLELNLFRSSD